MNAVIEQHVITDEQNEATIAEHTANTSVLQHDLDKCKTSIKTIERDCKPLWSSDKAVVEKLREEEKKLEKKIKELTSDRGMRVMYRPIDLSFLRRKQNAEVPRKISVPLFSVHKIHEDSIDAMRIQLSYHPGQRYRSPAVVFRGREADGTNRSNYKLSEVFGQHFIEAVDMGVPQGYKWSRSMQGEYYATLVAGGRKFRSIRRSKGDVDKNLDSEFIGIIPSETKEQITTARELTDEVYLIKEAKWEVKEVVVDPLIVCLSPSGQAYFVTSFDCTPVEYWAKKEYQE